MRCALPERARDGCRNAQETRDVCRKPPPLLRPQVVALRQEVARLQLLLQVSEAKIAMWEECMQQLVHCVRCR